MSRLLLILMTVLGLTIPSLAGATTVAVLPLEKGAAEDRLEGLGTALSGMIVSDLAEAQGIVLVERQRLDNLISEMELGKSGFLDPDTAVRLGQGLGAELVLVGSFSVIEGTLALDARLVEVKTGHVLDGATAQGVLADFVTVEKTLVEGLLEKLHATLDARARRDFYSRVPTENWEAFTAWSEGKARVGAGELEAARKAFERALLRDPAFTDAVEGLNALKALAEQTRAADTSTRSTRYAAAEAAVLAGTTDVRATKGDLTAPMVAGLPVRWAVLFNQGQHCQRLDEMTAYLDRVQWDPAAHRDTLFENKGRWTQATRETADALGYTPWDRSMIHPEKDVVIQAIASREATLWSSTQTFLFHDLARLLDRDDVGMVASLLACATPARAEATLGAWRKRLEQYGQADQVGDRYGAALTNEEQIDLMLAWSEALQGAISPARGVALRALLERHPNPDDPKHTALLALLDGLTRTADFADRTRAGHLGLSVATIRTRLEGLAAGGLRSKPDWCAANFERTWDAEARRTLKAWQQEEAEGDDAYHEIRSAALLVRIAGDLGCLPGVDGRFADDQAVQAHARTMAAHKHPVHGDESHCEASLGGVEQLATMPLGYMQPGQLAQSLLQIEYTLVQLRCLVETP